ncbi:MAG: helix-turn-helix domain-containing protein [Tepidisphaeraceae bacterium]
MAIGLSPQQLAAARLLARGRKVADVAAELGVTRQALWKWRRRPPFAAEVRRLHELLARR